MDSVYGFRVVQEQLKILLINYVFICFHNIRSEKNIAENENKEASLCYFVITMVSEGLGVKDLNGLFLIE